MTAWTDDKPLFDLAVFEKDDNEAIERYVADLPKERVAEALLFMTTIRKALSVGEKMATSRMEAETILGAGEVWTSPDGREFMWAGDRRRECGDPEGLQAALKSLEHLPVLAFRALRAAFKTETKVYMTELDKITKLAPEAKDVVHDFVEWKEGPRKLRALDEAGR